MHAMPKAAESMAAGSRDIQLGRPVYPRFHFNSADIVRKRAPLRDGFKGAGTPTTARLIERAEIPVAASALLRRWTAGRRNPSMAAWGSNACIFDALIVPSLVVTVASRPPRDMRTAA